MTAKFALLFILAQGLSSVAQLTTGPFFYACFPSSPSSSTLPSICPALPITFDDAFFAPTCLCTDITDATGAGSVLCASFDNPSIAAPTFDALCGGSELSLGNTCDDIQGLNNITNGACGVNEDVSTALKFLCAKNAPADIVETALSLYPAGKIVLDLLDLACDAAPTVNDIKLICKGIDAMSAGCDLVGGSAGSASSGSPASPSSTAPSSSSASSASGSGSGSGSSGSGSGSSGSGSGSSSKAPSPSGSSSSQSSDAREANYLGLVLPAVVVLTGILSHVA